MSGLVAIVTTVATRADADRLADAAVEARLAACVQISPIASVYRWKGRVEHDAEYRLVFKTTRRRADDLVRLLDERHPYELPAVFALAVESASAAYEHWVAAETTPAGDPGR